MKNSFYYITVDVHSISSRLIQPRNFYTVFLEIGSKLSQIDVRKYTNTPGVLDIGQEITVKGIFEELQACNNSVKLNIYSIHNYGQKQLFGTASFKVAFSNASQLKINLKDCADDQAYIEFRCSSKIIEARKESKGSSRKIYRQTNRIHAEFDDLNCGSVFSKKDGKSPRSGSVKNAKKTDQYYTPIKTQRPNREVERPLEKRQNIEVTRSIELTSKNTNEISHKSTMLEYDSLALSEFYAVSKHEILETEETIKNATFQNPGKIVSIKEFNNDQVLSYNLGMIENYSNLLRETRRQYEVQSSEKVSKSSKDQVQKLIANLNENIKKVHKQEEIFNNEEQIDKIIKRKKDQNANLQKINSIQTIKNTTASKNQTEDNSKVKLKLYTHVHDLIYKNSKQPAILRVRSMKDEDSPVYRKYQLLRMESYPLVNSEQQILKQDNNNFQNGVISTEKLILRPNNNFESLSSLQQFEKDDNLIDIVQGMIKQSEGDLGYVKLSKLTLLRNKIKQMKDQNKHLLWVNQFLVENQRFLNKKLQMAKDIIKQKQKNFNEEIRRLKQKFQEVCLKIDNKNSLEIIREAEIQELKQKIVEYENNIKDLNKKLKLKDEQTQHYKLLLVADQSHQKEKINESVNKESKQKKKFQRYSSSTTVSAGLLQKKKKVQLTSIFSQKYIDQNLLSIKKEDNKTSGIDPAFKKFFMAFLNKEGESSGKLEQDSSSKFHMKRGTKIQQPTSIQQISETGQLTQI